MPKTTPLSPGQRAELAALLQSHLADFEHREAVVSDGLTQAEAARQTLLQDADDASQRAGEHEVEGIVADIDSAEFNDLRAALQRLRGVGYGVCVDCNTAIPFARLRLEPQALRCAACQTLHERHPSA